LGKKGTRNGLGKTSWNRLGRGIDLGELGRNVLKGSRGFSLSKEGRTRGIPVDDRSSRGKAQSEKESTQMMLDALKAGGKLEWSEIKDYGGSYFGGNAVAFGEKCISSSKSS